MGLRFEVPAIERMNNYPEFSLEDDEGNLLLHSFQADVSNAMDRHFANYAANQWLTAWVRRPRGENLYFPWGQWSREYKARLGTYLWEWWQEEGRFVVGMHIHNAFEEDDEDYVERSKQETLSPFYFLHPETIVRPNGIWIYEDGYD